MNKNATYMKDFICSTPGYGGITTCDDVPRFRLNGVECNETLESLFGVDLWNFTTHVSAFNSSTSSLSSTCINWNAYYTDCRPGSTNPFQGSISFDNIGLAWIAIFQVIRSAGFRGGRTRRLLSPLSGDRGRPDLPLTLG